MKIFIKLVIVGIATFSVALLITWILGIPVYIFGREFDKPMFFSVISTMIALYLYVTNKSSPHNLAASYLEFLNEHGIKTEQHNRASLLLKALLKSLTVIHYARFELLRSLGAEALARIPGADAGNLTLLSIALFSSSEPALQDKACREISCDDEAVKLVFAYLDLSWDSAKIPDEDAALFKLGDLPRLAPERIKLRGGDGNGAPQTIRRRFDLELAQLRAILKQGRWPRSLAEILRALYEPQLPSRETLSLLDFLNRRPWVRWALQRLFEQLPVTTIERYLASRQFNAYLLSFVTPDEGAIAAPLNVLGDPDRWTNGGQPYLIEQYTNNARIGLVPQGWSLERFAKQLSKDFPEAVRISGKPRPQGGEVIVHRLGLSGRDYYNLEVAGIDEHQAIAKLRELLARGVEQPDLISVLEKARDSNDLIDDMIDCPLEDLAGPLEVEERQRLSTVSDRLRSAILKSLNIDKTHELAEHVRTRILAQDIPTAANAMLKILETQRYPWTIERIREIVQSYLETLQSLVALRGADV